jgi:hypothetical protein
MGGKNQEIIKIFFIRNQEKSGCIVDAKTRYLQAFRPLPEPFFEGR